MTLHYTDANVLDLRRPIQTENGYPQIMPRVSQYGGSLAAKIGLVPMADYTDEIIDEADWKEVIRWCRERQLFPEFHQHETWAPEGFRWSQNGLNYCWGWSLTAGAMDRRAVEGKPLVLLAPNTLGGAVGWRNNGYYLDAAIEWASVHGIAPASYVPDPYSINPASFKDGWEQAALLNRPTEWWDTQRSSGIKSFISQCLTILKTGTSVYAAWYRLSHAMSVSGMIWDESVAYNIRWVVRNSHNESDHIHMSGETAVPDEGYGIRAMETSDE